MLKNDELIGEATAGGMGRRADKMMAFGMVDGKGTETGPEPEVKVQLQACMAVGSADPVIEREIIKQPG